MQKKPALGTEGDFLQTTVGGLGTSPIPWDEQAARRVLQHSVSGDGSSGSLYSTIMYQGQHVRVYTLIHNDLGSLQSSKRHAQNKISSNLKELYRFH